MDDYKVFNSGHLFGVGQIVVVTTATEKMGCYFVETFAFSIYNEDIFKGRIIEYKFDASEIIESEMKLYATLIINDILFEQYKQKKDIDLINQNPEPVEINRSILLYMKSHNLHLDKLQGISKDSLSESLKDYLGRILSLPSIVVEDYKSRK